MDPRGLVELDEHGPEASPKIDGEQRASSTPRDLTTRKINAELRRLIYEQGIKDVTILNPCARHSLGVGHPARAARSPSRAASATSAAA